MQKLNCWLDVLIEWKKYVESKKGLSNSIKNSKNEAFIFPNQYGQLRSYQGFRKQFARFLNENCLSEYGITFHRFRHTFATMMMENCVNPRVVQEMLGHRDIETTLGVYTSVSVSAMEKASKLLSNKISEIMNNESANKDEVHRKILAG